MESTRIAHCSTLCQCGPTLGAKSVTNIILYLTIGVVHSPVSSQNIQASSSRGDSNYPWVSVHVLGHNLSKDRILQGYPLIERATSNMEYTKLHAQTLYSTLLSRYIVNFLL